MYERETHLALALEPFGVNDAHISKAAVPDLKPWSNIYMQVTVYVTCEGLYMMAHISTQPVRDCGTVYNCVFVHVYVLCWSVFRACARMRES